MSKARHVCTYHLNSRKKCGREPSRIPYWKVIRLFRKARKIRDAVQSYLKRFIPSSSKLKLMLSECNRHHFMISEWLARSKRTSSSKKYFVKQNMYLSVVRLRTFKHKKSPLFCMYVDERLLKELNLKHWQVRTYHVSHRIISLSGDVEMNPGPSDLVPVANSVSLLETRLSELNRSALDVGGGGDFFFHTSSMEILMTIFIYVVLAFSIY